MLLRGSFLSVCCVTVWQKREPTAAGSRDFPYSNPRLHSSRTDTGLRLLLVPQDGVDLIDVLDGVGRLHRFRNIRIP